MDEIVKVDYIKNINWALQKQSRSGAILYKLHKNKFIFLLGIDTESDNITDFGGGIKLKYENPVKGGLRELAEESCGVIGYISPEEIQDHIVIYNENMMIMLIHIDFDQEKVVKEFDTRVKSIEKPEVSSLITINCDQFIDLIKGKQLEDRTMYIKIRELLSAALNKDFISML